MERLTYKVHDGGIFVKESDVKTFDVEDEIMHTGNAIIKLAAYENLDDQGRLLKLPCALNSTVYEIDTCFYEDREKCIGCEYFYEGDSLFRDDPCCEYCDDKGNELNPNCLVVLKRKATLSMIEIWIKNNSFGKTVFLTQVEVEEALKKMEENHAGSI